MKWCWRLTVTTIFMQPYQKPSSGKNCGHKGMEENRWVGWSLVIERGHHPNPKEVRCVPQLMHIHKGTLASCKIHEPNCGPCTVLYKSDNSTPTHQVFECIPWCVWILIQVDTEQVFRYLHNKRYKNVITRGNP